MWHSIARSIFLFVTSSLTAGATISAAVKSLHGDSGDTWSFSSWSPHIDINIYSSNPASNTALANGDYASLGTTPFCDTPIGYAGWSTAGYNDFALNAAGIAAINKTGITKLGTRNANYDVANSAPTWASDAGDTMAAFNADRTGTANDPKLAVAYTLNTGTVLTEYPDADPETSTVDGAVGFYSEAANTWATVRDNAGSGVDDTALSDVAAYIRAYSTTDTWTGMSRGIFLFNTSALTGSAVISAATKSLYGVSKRDDVAWNAALNIYTSAPASNTALEAGDFDSLGTVAQSDTSITHDSWSIAGYNDFALNSTGIGNISKTGITKFGSRFATYDVANSAPTWSSLAINRVNCYYADQTGTTNDPKLVVTYSTYTEDVPYVIAYVTRTDLFAGSSRT
jgi:hypothetical protein